MLIWSITILMTLSTIALATAQVPRQNPALYTDKQWTALYATISPLPLAQRIALWGDLAATDTQYVLDPLGEGPGATPDADPLLDFQRVDCLTFVEQVYALALARDRAGFDDMLRCIRYGDGQIAYRWRNHYTVSDWLPANRWFMCDLTEPIAPGLTRSMTKTIARGQFFAKKGLLQYSDLPDEAATTAYIPRDRVAQALGGMRTGDMAIFVIDTPGIIAGHTGLLRVQDGTVYLQHASATKRTVVTVPLLEYMEKGPARFMGLKVVRPCEPIAAP